MKPCCMLVIEFTFRKNASLSIATDRGRGGNGGEKIMFSLFLHKNTNFFGPH